MLTSSLRFPLAVATPLRRSLVLQGGCVSKRCMGNSATAMPAANIAHLGGPSDKTIVIAGYSGCGYFESSKRAAQSISKTRPEWAAFEVCEFPSRSDFHAYLGSAPEAGRPSTSDAQSHRTSPFVYFKHGAFIGGNDSFQAMAKSARVL